MRGLTFKEKSQTSSAAKPKAVARSGQSTRVLPAGVASSGAQDSANYLIPQQIIKSAVAKVVADKFNLTCDLRVVRQHRAVGGSVLQFIDYAVPCFELAKSVNL